MTVPGESFEIFPDRSRSANGLIHPDRSHPSVLRPPFFKGSNLRKAPPLDVDPGSLYVMLNMVVPEVRKTKNPKAPDLSRTSQAQLPEEHAEGRSPIHKEAVDSISLKEFGFSFAGPPVVLCSDRSL